MLLGLGSGRLLLAQAPVLTVVSHPFAAEGEISRLGGVVGELLTVQWAGRGQRRVIPGTSACCDPACGAESARRARADGALVGRIHGLAGKLTLTAYWVRPDGTVVASSMVTADDEAHLPDATRQLAFDLEESARLSTAGSRQAPPGSASVANPALAPSSPAVAPLAIPVGGQASPEQSRAPVGVVRSRSLDDELSLRAFPVLRLGYAYPLSGTLPSAGSLSGELSAVFVQGPLLIEPRIAFRRSFNRDGEWYGEVPMDVGVYVRWPHGDIFPLLGGGIGGHYLMMQQHLSGSQGEGMDARHVSETIGSAFAFGGFARAGFGVKPSRGTTFFATGDIEVTAGELFGRSPHWLTALNVGLGFGG